MRSRGGSKCVRDTFATMLFTYISMSFSTVPSVILIILINSRKGDLRAELEKVTWASPPFSSPQNAQLELFSSPNLVRKSSGIPSITVLSIAKVSNLIFATFFESLTQQFRKWISYNCSNGLYESKF